MTDYSKLEVVLYDPTSDTKVTWPIGRDGFFGVTVKKAMGDLINAVARKKGVSPVQVMTSPEAKRFVLRVQPRGKGQNT